MRISEEILQQNGEYNYDLYNAVIYSENYVKKAKVEINNDQDLT
jgi:hypothetical protein